MKEWTSTTESHEAALLLTMGVPLLQSARVKSEQGDRVLHHFAPRSADGSRHVGEMLAVWRTGAEALSKSRPHDNLTWMRAYAENLEYLRRTEQAAPELVHLCHRGRGAIINPNDPQVVQDAYLRRLGV